MATAHMNVKGRTSLDGSGWAAGLRKMETGTKAAAGRMASSMAGMVGGLFAVSALRGATARIIDHGDAIDKMAKRMEASTDTAQKFDFAASQNGASVGDIEKAFTKTAASMEGAKQGLQTQIRAFAAFGISMQMIKNSTPEEIFLKIADSIEKAGGALDRAKSLQDIMGRSGRQLTPAFVSGFAATAAAAPTPIGKETIKALADLKDSIDVLERQMAKPAAEVVAGTSGIIDAYSKVFAARANAFEKIGKPQKGEINALEFLRTFSEEYDKLYMEETAGKGTTKTFSPPLKQSTEILDKLKKEREAALNDPNASMLENFLGFRRLPEEEKPQTSFVKPSLALNALQRIGAAVSQSADPIAIEKDNNVLLKRIANNTKDTARNTE
jgi:hypothetical protein